MAALDGKEAEYSGFEMPPPLVVPNPERFARNAGIIIAREAHEFFSGARLAPGLSGYIRLFRKALKTVPFTELERTPYEKWLAMDAAAEIKHGMDCAPLNAEELTILAAANDPSVYVVGELEKIRLNTFPLIAHDVSVRQRVFGTYAVVTAGIHCDKFFE